MALSLTSSAFENGDPIPPEYTCDGDNMSPPLEINGVPPNTRTLALVMDDPDAPTGTFDHWVVWNIDPGIRILMEGKGVAGKHGMNSAGTGVYTGPCPPFGIHHYRFKLYAVDIVLDLREGSRKEELEAVMEGHIIEEAELIGTYTRKR